MKNIKLSQGKFAKVDDDVFDYLNQWKWTFDRSTGYAIRRIHGITSRKVYMHRLINKTSKNLVTDHVNGDKLDNQSANLRVATEAQNRANQKKRSDNTSGYKGVSYNKLTGKWETYITANRKRIHIGLFEDINEAAKAYNAKAVELFGYYAKLNTIKEGE